MKKQQLQNLKGIWIFQNSKIIDFYMLIIDQKYFVVQKILSMSVFSP